MPSSPPRVMVPKQRRETRSPVSPNVVYCMDGPFRRDGLTSFRGCDDGAGNRGVVFWQERATVSGTLELSQRPVYELNAHRALAHRGGDALHAARPHIADREDARLARLQEIGSTGQRPSCLLEVTREEVSSCLDEVLVVERHASLEPRGVRVGAGHQEQVTDRAGLRFPGVELAPSDPLEAVGSLSRAILRPRAP